MKKTAEQEAGFRRQFGETAAEAELRLNETDLSEGELAALERGSWTFSQVRRLAREVRRRRSAH